MNDRDFNFPLLLPNLAVLLFVAVGLLSNRAPLVSHRPMGGEPLVAQQNDVPARLWEDPFGVKPPLSNETSEPLLKGSLASARSDKDSAIRNDRVVRRGFRLLVLPVLLPSENYSETIEQRLRTRYAVISALGRAQYVSTKPERLQFAFVKDLTIPFEEFDVRRLVADNVAMVGNENYWPEKSSRVSNGTKNGPLTIEHPFDRIVVLWVDEQKLLQAEPSSNTGQSAANRLHVILNHFIGPDNYPANNESQQAGLTAAEVAVKDIRILFDRLFGLSHFSALFRGEQAGLNDTEVSVKIVGPTSSDKLVSLLERKKTAYDSPEENVAPGRPGSPRHFELLSPRATAPDAAIQISITHDTVFQSLGLDTVPDTNPPWKVRRTIAKDDLLVDTVLEELDRRRAKPGPKNHLVLIGEWDTVYSRALARTFAAKLNVGIPVQFANAAPSIHQQSTWANNPDYLHEFSYLRGLDGRLPGAGGASKTSSSPGSEEDEKSDTSETDDILSHANRESPEGTSQLDYLRRLEGSVRDLQRRLLEDGGKIAAIGVIGSDTYDKLLVLRALRANFPTSVFFTTDFDASYVDRDEDKWTTNLVVVSPFGLTTSPALQGRIPPFRDSYQTALFLTILDAVGVTEVGDRKLALGSDSIVPRIFELGRAGYVDLSSPEIDQRNAALHPFPVSNNLELWWLALLTAGLGFVWLWWKTSPKEFFECSLGLLWLGALIGWFALVVRSKPPGLTSLGSLAPLVLGMVILLPFYKLQRRCSTFRDLVTRPHARWADRAVLLLCGCLVGGAAAMLVFAFRRATGWNEEPFAWFKGLSIWPSEIVRLAAAVFAVLAIVLAQSRLDRLKKELTSQFFPNDDGTPSQVKVRPSVHAKVVVKNTDAGQPREFVFRNFKKY